MPEITEYDDWIQLTDIRDRISELETELEDALAVFADTAEISEELTSFRELEKAITDYEGNSAMADRGRAAYVRDTTDGGDVPPWLRSHIDWDSAADEYLTDFAQFTWRDQEFTVI